MGVGFPFPVPAGDTYLRDRPPSSTKIGRKKVHVVRVRGGNKKYRALRLDHGNFSWGSMAIAHKTRILDVAYNASSNDLIRTKSLVKNCVVFVDASPFRKWYESHYGLSSEKIKGPAKDLEVEAAKKSNHLERKLEARKPTSKVDPHIEDQLYAGRLLAIVTSRPGQSG